MQSNTSTIETIKFYTGDGWIDEITTHEDGSVTVLRAYTPGGWNTPDDEETY